MTGGRSDRLAGGPAGGQAVMLPAFDVERVRADFPILSRQVRGGRLAYLDSAATAQKPRAVVEALSRFYFESNSNVHRGVHLLAEEATLAYDAARERVRQFLNAGSAEEIVFTSGTTAGLNLLAQGLVGSLKPGDEIVLTIMEHHSNIVPWQLAAHRVGAVLRAVPVLPDGSLDLDELARLVNQRTRIVTVSHISNVLGTVAPVARMAALAHQVGALVVVDAAQSAPHVRVDVRELGCDFLVFSGHKLYGPMGVGVLYGRRHLLERLPPWQGGGGMIERVTIEASSWAPPPTRFEAGTPPVAEAVGLAAAIDYLDALDRGALEAHEAALLAEATERLQAIDGVRIIGTAPGKVAVLSFVLEGIHPHDVGTILDARGVAVRAGHHCAQPLMRHFEVPATLRASFGLYNNRDDVDQLVEALGEARRRFRP
jgi:cysteine desulfurase/selenocysteine lyase